MNKKMAKQSCRLQLASNQCTAVQVPIAYEIACSYLDSKCESRALQVPLKDFAY